MAGEFPERGFCIPEAKRARFFKGIERRRYPEKCSLVRCYVEVRDRMRNELELEVRRAGKRNVFWVLTVAGSSSRSMSALTRTQSSNPQGLGKPRQTIAAGVVTDRGSCSSYRGILHLIMPKLHEKRRLTTCNLSEAYCDRDDAKSFVDGYRIGIAHSQVSQGETHVIGATSLHCRHPKLLCQRSCTA